MCLFNYDTATVEAENSLPLKKITFKMWTSGNGHKVHFHACMKMCPAEIDWVKIIGEDGNFSGEGLGLNFPLGGGAIFQPRGEGA